MSAYLVGLVEWGLEASILDQRGTVADHLPPPSACLLYLSSHCWGGPFVASAMRKASHRNSGLDAGFGTHDLIDSTSSWRLPSFTPSMPLWSSFLFLCARIDIGDRQCAIMYLGKAYQSLAIPDDHRLPGPSRRSAYS